MDAPKRPYVSPETLERLADLRRRMSATEGRQVTTDEVVSRMIDAAEGRITGAAELYGSWGPPIPNGRRGGR